MDLGIKGKRALILASSQGLGLGIATKLCEEGANVIISSRVEDKLVTVAKELNNSGPGTADHGWQARYRPLACADRHHADSRYRDNKPLHC